MPLFCWFIAIATILCIGHLGVFFNHAHIVDVSVSYVTSFHSAGANDSCIDNVPVKKTRLSDGNGPFESWIIKI